MKSNKISTLVVLAAALFLTSCQIDSLGEGTESGDVSQVKFVAEDFIYDGVPSPASTKVDFTITSSGAKFKWSSADTVGICPSQGSQVYFCMNEGAGTSSAMFTGGAWALKGGYLYRSYYPFIGDMYLDVTSIPVSYLGQKQSGNGGTSHIGAYDFMAASGTTSESGSLVFKYKSLESLLQFKLITGEGTFQSITVETDTAAFIHEGTYDLTSDSDMAVRSEEFFSSVELALDNVTVASGDSVLTAYMMIAPANLSGRTLKITVKGEGLEDKVFNIPAKDYKQGYAYQICEDDMQYVSFEDENFKAYIVSRYDSNGDGEITVAEARTVDTIRVSSDGIFSVKGVEYMPNLVYFRMSGTSTSLDGNSGLLTSVDLSSNPLLEILYCDKNNITKIDVSGNPNLKTLYCGSNKITEIKFGDNAKLTYLACSNNELDTLALGTLTALEKLYCNYNSLTSLVIGSNPNLVDVSCTYNQISPSIDISENYNLTAFNCLGNYNLYKIIVWADFDKEDVFKKPAGTEYVEVSNVIDLSADGTSNCYIAPVRDRFKYSFNASVKGNSTEIVGTAASVKVLWESNGNPSVAEGDVIRRVTYKSGKVTFESVADGNALVAVLDENGIILWSWHIWVTSYDLETETYPSYSHAVMNRNLGALSSTKGDSLATGLLYQWGRKDPFPGAKNGLSNEEMAITGKITYQKSNAITGTASYVAKCPTTFITSEQESEDWIWGDVDNRLWSSTKTMYDPCPAGWRVADGGSNGAWGSIYLGNYDSSNKGCTLSSSTPAAWYPCGGIRTASEGSIVSSGTSGGVWSVTTYQQYVYAAYMTSSGFSGISGLLRGNGLSVRCCKE